MSERIRDVVADILAGAIVTGSLNANGLLLHFRLDAWARLFHDLNMKYSFRARQVPTDK